MIGFSKGQRSRIVKWILLTVISVAVIAVIVVFIGYRRLLGQNEALLKPLKQKADIAITDFEQTATKNGITEWHLRAKSARYRKAQEEAVLEDLSVTFYLQNGQQAHLTAERGTIMTKSKDLTVNGNVLADSGGYRLKTEAMHYLHNQHILLSRVPVQISGPAFQIEADSIRFDLTTQQTLLEGNVDGKFSDRLAL